MRHKHSKELTTLSVTLKITLKSSFLINKNSKSIFSFIIFSTIVKMKITKCLDWHIEGEIIERNCQPEPVSDDYVIKMKKDLEEEK